MAAEILKPFGDYKTPGPSADVIELLAETLEMAVRGDVTGIAIAMIRPDTFVKTRAIAGNHGMATLLGAVTVMQDDIIRMWKAND